VVRVVAGDLIIILVGLIIVRIVDMELAESLAGVKTTGAIAVDSAKILVRVVTKDLVIILIGLIMVRIVGVQLAESLVGIKTIGILAVDLAKILIRFIVIN